MISKLLVGLVVIVGGLAGFPLAWEGSSSSCTALEAYVLRAQAPRGGVEGALARGLVETSNGALARARVAQIYPNLPPWLGCYVAYWNGTGAAPR